MSVLEEKKHVLALLKDELLAMRAERLRESNPSDDHRVGFIATGAPDCHARACGLTFAERLDRAEDEDTLDENAYECVTDVARSAKPAISPAKENFPPSESGERNAQNTACQVPVRMKYVCHRQQTSRPRVRRDNRLVNRRSPACVCNECK